MSSTIDIYHQVAEGFASQYNALKPEEVHQSWRSFWPTADALVLDIGAGSAAMRSGWQNKAAKYLRWNLPKPYVS